MIALNLTANGNEQTRVKDYLESNVSQVLADKINNGVKITKDNKTLLNKKTLDGFMSYACEEARKQAEKGKNCACIEDNVVFGWAIHYFEEDSIEGNLYNEDGSEYKPTPKVMPKPKVEVKQPPKPENKQASLFDLFDAETPKQADNSEETEIEEELEEEVEKPETVEIEPKKVELPAFYSKYLDRQNSYPEIIVLTKLGDFYEAFGNTAQIVANELDLTLTGRDFGLDARVPLAGFPYHVAENYFEKLSQKHTLLVIENDDERFIEQKTETKQENKITTENKTFDKYLLKTIATIFDNKVELV